MKLFEFVIRRLLLLIPVLIGLSLVTFTISHIIPADPGRAWAGEKASDETVEAVEEEYHLNDPWHMQYYYYMDDLLHGDFGDSPTTNRPVREDIENYFPATFELTLVAMVIVILVGVPLGIFSAVRRNKLPDHVIRIFSLMGSSMPIFWLGLLLQMTFSFYPGIYFGVPIFPPKGRIGAFVEPPDRITGLYIVDSVMTLNGEALLSSLVHIILPAVTLSFAILGIIMRITRSSMLDVMNKEYIKTARAKGLSYNEVIQKHAVKNAMIPTVTILGMAFGGLLGGAVLTETIFAWPGMGTYSLQAIRYLDFPAIMGFTLLIGFVYVIANLVVDIMYAYLDPRIRLGG